MRRERKIYTLLLASLCIASYKPHLLFIAMPYRKQPNTDAARISSLEKIIAKNNTYHNSKLVIEYKYTQQAEVMLHHFRQAYGMYNQSYDSLLRSSKQYGIDLRITRMYVSHFMTVLNMCFMRKEIKHEYKSLYQFDEDMQFPHPDLGDGATVLEWGKKIIEGEQARISRGGTPIYNPTIAKVRVHYDKFTDAYRSKKTQEANTDRFLLKLKEMRPQVDSLISQIWDVIEKAYSQEEPTKSYKLNESFGISYEYEKEDIKEIKPTVDQIISF